MFKLILFFLFIFNLANSAQKSEDDWTMEKFNLSLVSPNSVAPVPDPEIIGIRKEAVSAILGVYEKMNKNGRLSDKRTLKSVMQHVSDLEAALQNLESYPELKSIVGFNSNHIGKNWRYGQLRASIGSPDAAPSLTRILLPNIGTPLKICLQDIEKPGRTMDCLDARMIAHTQICTVFAPSIDPDFPTRQAFIKKKKEEWKEYTEDEIQNLIITGGGYFFQPTRPRAENVQPGDHLYAFGHPDYVSQHPLGSSRGEHLFCVGYNNVTSNRQYIGFGPLFLEGPKSMKQIQIYLAEQYVGKDRFEEETLFLTVERDEAFQAIQEAAKFGQSVFTPEIVKEIRQTYPQNK